MATKKTVKKDKPFPEVLYVGEFPVFSGGDSIASEDLKAFQDGEKVAVYRLDRVSQLVVNRDLY